jgi:cobalt-zinc-cadmium efflux system outer membrane protein
MVSGTLVPFPGSPFNEETRQGGPPQFDIGLSYSVDTLIFGTRSAAMEATRLGVDVAFAEYAEVARQRILEAIHAYYDVLEARAQLEIAREEAEQLDRLHGITERRVQLGSVGHVELDRMRVALAGGRRRLRRAEAELDNAKSRLRAHLGRAAFANRVDAVGTLEIGSLPSPPDLRSAMQLAEERRPDLVALKRQVARASADLTVERRTAWPSLTVAAGYTRQFQEQAIGFPDANSWGAGIEMSLPIFDRNQGNIARAQSAVRQADLLVSAARLDLRAELEQAIRDYEVAYQLVTALDEEALNAAAYVRQRVEEAYRLGGSTVLEVLDAQSAFREVYGEHIVARAEVLRALHSLNATVGTEIIR